MITDELRKIFETSSEPELIVVLRDAHDCGDMETAQAIRDEINRRAKLLASERKC